MININILITIINITSLALECVQVSLILINVWVNFVKWFKISNRGEQTPTDTLTRHTGNVLIS